MWNIFNWIHLAICCVVRSFHLDCLHVLRHCCPPLYDSLRLTQEKYLIDFFLVLAYRFEFWLAFDLFQQTADSLIAAYRFGSFIKIPEFTQFTQRLDLSLHFAAATAERMLLDLLLAESPGKLLNTAVGMYADADKDQPDDWSGLVDNRDCSIYISWHTPQQSVHFIPFYFSIMFKKTCPRNIRNNIYLDFNY